MITTKEELAALLNGREYAHEITPEECTQANAAGLVAIFGYSDDGVEVRGAFDEELGAWGGTTLYLHRDGVLPSEDSLNDCERCIKRLEMAQKECRAIAVCWDGKKDTNYSWLIKPDQDGSVSFAPFDIVEDGEPFCRGIVLALVDLPKLTNEV